MIVVCLLYDVCIFVFVNVVRTIFHVVCMFFAVYDYCGFRVYALCINYV